MKVPFPEPVEAARRNVAQVDGSRTGPAQGKASCDHFADIAKVKIGTLLNIVGESRTHQALAEIFDLRHPDPLSVEVRALPFLGVKELIEDGKVDRTELHLSLHFETNGDTEEGEPAGVIRGSIDGINDPSSGRPLALKRGLLGQNLVIGKR